MDFAPLDFFFTVVTTLFLGAITVIQFRSERRQAREEDARRVATAEAAATREAYQDRMTALEIKAMVVDPEVFGRLHKDPLDEADTDYLRRTHALAIARIETMHAANALSEADRQDVEAGLSALVSKLGNDDAAQANQDKANSRFGLRVTTNDRSKFAWAGEGQLSKYDVLQAVARTFAQERGIASLADFTAQFGEVVRSVVEQTGGEVRTFDSAALVDALPSDADARKRHQRVVDRFGALVLDGREYRAGWWLGYRGAPDVGRTIQLPVIEHFASLEGYPLARVR